MTTTTTTNDMTVSCHIAYGKNGFPRSLTSRLYCSKTRTRWTIRSSATDAASARCGTRQAGARRRGRRLDRPGACRMLRPRRRGDAEAHDEVEVQTDQREDRARQEQHVYRVEAAQRVGVDVRAALEELREERSEERRRSVDVDA